MVFGHVSEYACAVAYDNSNGDEEIALLAANLRTAFLKSRRRISKRTWAPMPVRWHCSFLFSRLVAADSPCGLAQDLNVERWGLGCAVAEGKIFAVGGKRQVREYQNTIEIRTHIQLVVCLLSFSLSRAVDLLSYSCWFCTGSIV